jgi:O-antigen/teichoic acid export membrane protein
VRPRLRELASDSAIYGTSGIVAKAIGIVLLPLYLHKAGKEAFGAVELIMSSITVAAILLRIGVVASMSRFTVGDAENEDWRGVIHTVFSFVMTMSTAAVVLGLLFLQPLADLLQVSRGLTAVGLAGLWVTMNYDVLTRIYRIERRPKAYVAYQLANVGITVVATVVLVLVLDMKAVGIALGNFAGTFLTYGAMLLARRGTVGVRCFDRALFRRIVDFSLPLMPANLAVWALNFADRFQVQRLAGKAELGSYSTASKIALGIALVVAAFQTAWPPFAHSIRGEQNIKQTLSAVFSYWAILMGWTLAAVTLLATPYVALALPHTGRGSVTSAIPVIPLLGAGTILYGGFLVVNMGVNMSMRTRKTPLVTGSAAAVNIGLNFLLIPAYGIVGAGVSTVLGYGVLVVLGWWNAQQSYPVHYDWDRVLRVAAVAAAYVAVSIWVVPATGLGPILLRVVLAASFPAGLLLVGALTPGDRRRARRLLRGLRPAAR